jgi:hypothetical protein
VLDVGLGRSPYLTGVRWVVPTLHGRASQLAAGAGPLSLKRLWALGPLAEAAAAGLFAFAVGKRNELVALCRPRLRLDEVGRLHDWDGGSPRSGRMRAGSTSGAGSR